MQSYLHKAFRHLPLDQVHALIMSLQRGSEICPGLVPDLDPI